MNETKARAWRKTVVDECMICGYRCLFYVAEIRVCHECKQFMGNMRRHDFEELLEVAAYGDIGNITDELAILAAERQRRRAQWEYYWGAWGEGALKWLAYLDSLEEAR